MVSNIKINLVPCAVLNTLKDEKLEILLFVRPKVCITMKCCSVLSSVIIASCWFTNKSKFPNASNTVVFLLLTTLMINTVSVKPSTMHEVAMAGVGRWYNSCNCKLTCRPQCTHTFIAIGTHIT